MLLLLHLLILTGCWGGGATRISPERAHADDTISPAQVTTMPTVEHFTHQPFANGVMWQISREGVIKAKIYGSLHIGDADDLGVPNELFDTLKAVARLALEVRPEEQLSASGELHRTLAGEGDLFQLLSPAKQLAFETAAVRYKADINGLRRLRPWAALASLQSGKYLFSQSIDDVLYAKARAQGTPIIGLESLDEQLQAADCAPLEGQLLLLNESLTFVDQFDAINARMLALYRLQATGELLDYALRSLPLSKAAQAVEDLDRQCLLSRRNQRMARRLERLLPEGNLLIVIGAFHLVGHDGVLCRLQYAGYDIEPVAVEGSRRPSGKAHCMKAQ